MQTPEDAALDALAVALAPRLLREVRALLAVEAGEDEEIALGIAVMRRLGYEPGHALSSGLAPPQPAGSKAKAKR